jgi:O-antigen ligase
MTHPFIKSGKLLTILLIACLIFYGLEYHITKTLLHVTGVIALITWVRIIALFSNGRWKRQIKLDLISPVTLMSLILLSSSLIIVFSSLITDTPQSYRFRDNFSVPALCFALTLPLAIINKKLLSLLYYALPLALILMAIPGIIDYYSQNRLLFRTSGNLSMPIIYATNLCVLTIGAITLMANSKLKNNPLLFFLLSTSIPIGAWATLLSGSRGPVLFLIVGVLTTLTMCCLRNLGVLKTFMIVLIAAFTLSVGISKTNMYERFHKDIENIKSEDKTSSIGLRLEMWKGSLDIIRTYPVAGIGIGQHSHFFEQKIAVDSEYMPRRVIGFPHLHNDFLNISAWIGIPLGLLFMAFAYYPFFWAVHCRRSPTSYVVLMTSLAFLLNGLTNSPSTRATSITLVLLVICLFMVASHSQDRVKR